MGTADEKKKYPDNRVAAIVLKKSPEYREWLRRAAEADGRKISDFVEEAIRQRATKIKFEEKPPIR